MGGRCAYLFGGSGYLLLHLIGGHLQHPPNHPTHHPPRNRALGRADGGPGERGRGAQAGGRQLLHHRRRRGRDFSAECVGWFGVGGWGYWTYQHTHNLHTPHPPTTQPLNPFHTNITPKHNPQHRREDGGAPAPERLHPGGPAERLRPGAHVPLRQHADVQVRVCVRACVCVCPHPPPRHAVKS